jgi:hypothetical protein
MSPMLIEVPCLNYLHQYPNSLSLVNIFMFSTQKKMVMLFTKQNLFLYRF